MDYKIGGVKSGLKHGSGSDGCFPFGGYSGDVSFLFGDQRI
ncbi:MAG: hypothetical protein U9Q96_02825 [Patescibacteria group bacterium]|nr:hypothetical protein [Patescibacteria group bacterium]